MDLLADKLQDLDVLYYDHLQRLFTEIKYNPEHYFKKELVRCDINSENTSYEIIIKNSLGSEFKVNYDIEEFEANHLDKIKSGIIHAIRFLTMDKSIGVAQNLLPQFFQDLNSIISLKSKRVNNENDDRLIKWIVNFRDEVASNYNFKQIELKMASSIPKIQWLGKINTLATLFIDMKEGTGGIDKKYIEADDADLKQIIVNNFLFQGQQISKETLNTYFDSGKRAEKRAKKDVIAFSEDQKEITTMKVEDKRHINKPSQPVYPVPKNIENV